MKLSRLEKQLMVLLFLISITVSFVALFSSTDGCGNWSQSFWGDLVGVLNTAMSILIPLAMLSMVGGVIGLLLRPFTSFGEKIAPVAYRMLLWGILALICFAFVWSSPGYYQCPGDPIVVTY